MLSPNFLLSLIQFTVEIPPYWSDALRNVYGGEGIDPSLINVLVKYTLMSDVTSGVLKGTGLLRSKNNRNVVCCTVYKE